MSKEERENWIKIKEHMERNNCTDNYFYERACAISDNKPDPLDPLK